MEFDEEVIRFNIFEGLRYPSDLNACFAIDPIDSIVQKTSVMSNNGKLEMVLQKNLNLESTAKQQDNVHHCQHVKKILTSLESQPEVAPKSNAFYLDLPVTNEKHLPSLCKLIF
ncbi:RNA-directed DNA polymerase [Abeliophyllum distichum]|uniref:RNA-directed DNA polymerase n=1 Tax=Abeliophyllum distichum TaxID=126358 RepID=A0ABD1RXX4_9LAMI